MDVIEKKKIVEKLDSIEAMLPRAVRTAIENGKSPDECANIYNQITQLLAEVKAEINSADCDLTGENELDGPRFNK